MSSYCVCVCRCGGVGKGCWYGNAVMLLIPCLLESVYSDCIRFVKHSNLKSNKPPQHSLCSRVLLVRVEVIYLISDLWKYTLSQFGHLVRRFVIRQKSLSLYYAAGHLLHCAIVIHLLPTVPVSSSLLSFLHHLNCSISRTRTHVQKHP